MISEKQLAANRKNAQKSTGPKTPAGKLAASQNALGAGIFSKTPLMPHETIEEFESFSRGVAEAYPIIDAVTAAFVERLITAMWRKRPLQIAEAAKLQLATRNENIVHEVNSLLRRSAMSPITPDDISDKREENFQKLIALQAEILSLNGEAISAGLSELSVSAPRIHQLLIAQIERKYKPSQRKRLSARKLYEELNLLSQNIQTQIANGFPGHQAHQMATLIKQERSMLSEHDFNLFSKYDTQINNEINRAIEGYKQHRTWLEKSVDMACIEE